MRHFRLLIVLVCMTFSANALAEFKLYDVDPNYREEVYGVLARALRPQQGVALANSIELLPTGQILIDAAPETHQQVAAVLAEIRRHEAEPTPRVTLQYWVVLGSAEAADADDTPPVLAEVLDEIREVHGPLSFRMLGNATLVTDSGMQGRAQGDFAIHQTAYVQGTRLHAELNMTFEYSVVTGQYQTTQGQGQGPGQSQNNPFMTTSRRQQGMQLSTSMDQGEFLVVGEHSVSDGIVGQGEGGGTLFYIVHWPEAD